MPAPIQGLSRSPPQRAALTRNATPECPPGGTHAWCCARDKLFRHCGAGFSLVEVLVAIVVLAVGLLGIAGMQLSVLKANDSARLRTLATLSSYAVIDRMRADPKAVFGDAQPKQAKIDLSACTAAIGSRDTAARWQRDFRAAGLPCPVADGGSDDALAIDCATTSACGEGNCEIIVRWDDSRNDPRGSTPHNSVFRVCTRLPVL